MSRSTAMTVKQAKCLYGGDVYIDHQFGSIASQISEYQGFICDLIEEEYGIAVSEIQQK